MSINQISAPNIGGILRAFVAKPEQVVSIDRSPTGEAVNFLPGYSWQKIELLDEGSSFSITEERSFDGPSYQVSAQLVHPHISQASNTDLEDYTDTDCLLAIMDGNEYFWLFGTLQEHMQLVANANSGNRPDNLNAYTIIIEGTLSRRPSVLLAPPSPF